MSKIYLPIALRKFTGNLNILDMGNVTTVATLLKELESQYPGIKSQLCDESGQVNPYTAIFVNSVDIRDLEQVNTSISERDEIHIVQAIAGG
jgi:sulfur-carrier protein